jgi:hypothetical protein
MKPKLPGLPTFSALMLSAVLTAWLGLWGPISIEGLWRWQTLIGGIITASGVIVAAWNVTRQMRLAAIGREQDRINRDLPGIRAMRNFLVGFVFSIDRPPKTRQILDRFSAINALTGNKADLDILLEKVIPSAPDFIRSEVVPVLHRLRTKTENLDIAYWKHGVDWNATPFSVTPITESDVTLAQNELDDAIAGFYEYYDALAQRIESERNRSDNLRRELDRYLSLGQ